MYNRPPSFRASILDRLMDDKPLVTTESMSEMHLDMSRYKQAVARDLESLLNSRRVDFDERIEALPQTRSSIMTYGITDLSSLSLLDPAAQGHLRSQIKTAIERHEPRLSRVRVSLDVPKGRDRQLRFRVDAVLSVHPQKPPVVFDAMLQLNTNTYRISETG
jgi:type VI secretion system protein ImpF